MFVMQSWIYFAANFFKCSFTNLLFSALAFGMFLCSYEKNNNHTSYQWKLFNDKVVIQPLSTRLINETFAQKPRLLFYDCSLPNQHSQELNSTWFYDV